MPKRRPYRLCHAKVARHGVKPSILTPRASSAAQAGTTQADATITSQRPAVCHSSLFNLPGATGRRCSNFSSLSVYFIPHRKLMVGGIVAARLRNGRKPCCIAVVVDGRERKLRAVHDGESSFQSAP